MRMPRLYLTAALAAALALVGQAAGDGTDKKATSAGAACDKATGRQALQVSRDGEAGQQVGDGEGGRARGKRAGFKGGKGGKKGAGFGGLSTDQIVDRLMAFDKNGDGKVTKDELPERMQDLVARGDTNKDGALDRDEIRKMASTLGRDTFAGGFGGGRGFARGKGFDGFGGFAKGKGKGKGFGGFGGFVGPGGSRAALAGLNLSSDKKEKAEAAVKAYQENVRRLTELARSDLLVKMKDILSEQEYKSFKDNLDRRPGAGLVGTGGAPAALERRLDRLQKELEDLRRELRR